MSEKIEIVSIKWYDGGCELYPREQAFDMFRRPGETDNELIARAAERFMQQRRCYPVSGCLCRGKQSVHVYFERPAGDTPVKSAPAKNTRHTKTDERIAGFFQRYNARRN